MHLTLAPNELRLRIKHLRPSQFPARDREPERREMLALQKVVQVRGREVTELGVHARIVEPAPAGPAAVLNRDAVQNSARMLEQRWVTVSWALAGPMLRPR